MIEIITGNAEFLNRIQPLWEELHAHHLERIAPHFIESFEQRQFAQKKEDVLQKTDSPRIDIAVDTSCQKDIGYCISVISAQQAGEVDSLYVKPAYRKQGVATALMKQALAWMDEHAVKQRALSVMVGNENVLEFYARFGFYPRNISLQQV